MNYDTLKAFQDLMTESLGLDRFDMWLNDENTISLNMLEVPVNDRSQGIGTRAMNAMVAFADQHQCRMVLTPEAYDKHGNRNKRGDKRLTRWYKSFGFVINRGRHKDWEIYDYMYRNPT